MYTGITNIHFVQMLPSSVILETEIINQSSKLQCINIQVMKIIEHNEDLQCCNRNPVAYTVLYLKIRKCRGMNWMF